LEVDINDYKMHGQLQYRVDKEATFNETYESGKLVGDFSYKLENFSAKGEFRVNKPSIGIIKRKDNSEYRGQILYFKSQGCGENISSFEQTKCCTVTSTKKMEGYWNNDEILNGIKHIKNYCGQLVTRTEFLNNEGFGLIIKRMLKEDQD